MNFRIKGEPPRTTAQQKGVNTRSSKPIVYTKAKVKTAKQYFLWHLWKYKPPEPLEGAVYLKTVWTFGTKDKRKWGKYKITRPDTDNSLKLFKDCMTKTHYYHDDAQVVYETTVKMWGRYEDAGIEVSILPIGEEVNE